MHMLTLLDYIGKVMREDLKKQISKVNYYSVLSDGSTDTAVTEQETIYVIFICEGTTILKYLSIENVKNADALGLESTLEVAFNHFGITHYYDKLIGLNLDGASVNGESFRKLWSLHDSFRAACHTDSQLKKREEIKGFVNKWKDSGYLMHIAIFIDISPMCRLYLSLQRDKHNPVKITRRLNEFTCRMSKLHLIIENSLDENDDGQGKTCFKTFCLKVENDGGEFCYQDIKLAKYELTIKRAKAVYTSAISNICTKVEQRVSSFVESVAFSNILLLLDTKSWPKDDFVSFGNREINKLTDHYVVLLKKNGCDEPKFLANGPA